MLESMESVCLFFLISLKFLLKEIRNRLILKQLFPVILYPLRFKGCESEEHPSLSHRKQKREVLGKHDHDVVVSTRTIQQHEIRVLRTGHIIPLSFPYL
jgi:hypothetical protein